MELVSIVSTIFKLLQEIAKAAKTARHNRTRCGELARRTEDVGSVLGASMKRARGDAAPARRSILCRLKEALVDALKLVESCRRQDDMVSRLRMMLTSGSMAARFEDVHKRINACLIDLGTANGVSIESKIDQLAARDRHPRTNKPKQKQINAGNAPRKGSSKNNKNGGWNKGGQNGGNGGNRKRGKKAAAGARPLPPRYHAGFPSYPNGHGYSIEEDPTACSVM